MPDDQRYTLFSGAMRLAQGDLKTVAEAARNALADQLEPAMAFSDTTGRVVDLDLRGSMAEVAARYAQTEAQPSKIARGRPKLGVVAREVTLLPNHR